MAVNLNENDSLYAGKMLFSLARGDNYYTVLEVQDNVIKARHMKYNEYVNIKIYDAADYGTGISIEGFSERFVFPPGDAKFIWPIDVVEISLDKVSDDGYLLIGKIGLVFKPGSSPSGYLPLREMIYRPNSLGWEKQNVALLAVNIVTQLQRLYDFGYGFTSFDVDRIYYSPETWDVVFGFSFSSFNRFSNHMGNDQYKNCKVHANDLSMDFVPPWVQFENLHNIKKVSLAMEYYSVAALLFRLMIGRLPYQGEFCNAECSTLMEYDADEKDNRAHHQYMMKIYLNNPVFIFSQNGKNTIGRTAEEREMAERWDRLPLKIKNMFLTVFEQKEKDLNKKLYTPEEWGKALSELFCKEKLRNE